MTSITRWRSVRSRPRALVSVPGWFVRALVAGVRGREQMSPVRERDMTALSLFADEMKAAREQRCWSQADLAEKLPFSL